MSAPGRYFRTLVRLRPRQVFTRLARAVTSPRVRTGPAPEPRSPGGVLVEPVARSDGWLSPYRVRLLNVERELLAPPDGPSYGVATREAPPAIDWSPAGADRLWVYTLHYFADLPTTRLTAEAAAALVDSWIGSNPPGTRDAWDPYPVSLRVVAWVKWLLRGPASAREAPGAATGAAGANLPSARVLDSLATQLRFLERRLEFDIGANHLMANAVALTVGGLFFGGPEGDRWIEKGFRLLGRQLEEQVGGDGGHYERSPMYHAVVLEQLLDVLNVWSLLPDAIPTGRRDRREALETTVLSMFDWLTAMTHPDGGVSFFNDSVSGAAPSLADLIDYARRLGLHPGSAVFARITRLEDSSFFRLMSDDDRTVVLLDAGGPQPGHQPGHAHSEALSLELSRDGRRVFVNSGVSTYAPGPERRWQRQTAAHNTVRIDSAEQSELWASHRCGRRARTRDVGVRGRCAHASHDGYRFLEGRPVHRREVCVSDEAVEIVDKITGDGEHLLEWFFHLHPDITARALDRGVELLLDGRPLATVVFPFGAIAGVSPGAWHPEFGLSTPNTLLHVALSASLPFESNVTLRWL